MTLYINENCTICSRIRESLEETAVAHETIVVPEQGRSERLPAGTQTPVLVDGDNVIRGSSDILAYIEELRELRNEWLKYQSDVCYCD